MTQRHGATRSSALEAFGSQFSSPSKLKAIMIPAVYILAALTPTAANAWLEFGRHPSDDSLLRRHRIRREFVEDDKLKQEHQLEAATSVLAAFEEMLDEESIMLDISMSMSLSMSMSMPLFSSGGGLSDDVSEDSSLITSQIPSDAPSLVPTGLEGKDVTTKPTIMTTVAPAATPAPAIAAPTTTMPPATTLPAIDIPTSTTPPAATTNPAATPPTITAVPIGTAAPNGAPNAQVSDNSTAPTSAPEGGFECVGATPITLGDASDENTTAIFLAIGYRAESTSNDTADFIVELEAWLFETAVNAALGCFGGDFVVRRHLSEQHRRKLLIETDIVAPCEPTMIDEAESCTVMESEIVFFLKGDVDSDEAAYDGYKSIEENMGNDSYVGIVPTVVDLEYLSPWPLPVPPQLTGVESGTTPPEEVASARGGRLSLSPVTIGACIATIMGGLVSITVWSRKRQARNRHHIELAEESIETDSRNPVSI